ncbi:hypothetical protein RhiJN_13102 [Ceratobasidium sp. AG-Ba]|nr:hypothetical protein RhiJN_13102 [Ceratobasidium sp. AG-Ba]
MTYGAEWIGYKSTIADAQQKVINKAMKIAMGVASNFSLQEAFALAIELNIPLMEVTQNGLRTRLHEQVKNQEIKTYLYEMEGNDSHPGRKWTWFTGCNYWRSRYGELKDALPAWLQKANTYETHSRSNSNSNQSLDKVRLLRTGIKGLELGAIDELLMETSPEDAELGRELQIIANTLAKILGRQ